MLVVVSPAKRLDWSKRETAMSEPQFQDQANRLAGHVRRLPLKSLKSMMSLSDDLARLNRDRFRVFSDNPESCETRPAAYAFAGDTYLGFDAGSLGPDEQARAQSHMRILSGLYGILRPLDAIQAYRLEMGSRLKSRRGSNLYQFWGTKISEVLNETAREIGAETLVNCASQEYFGAVDQAALKMRIITPQFFEVGQKGPRMVSFFAKRARGTMARFIVDNRITDPAGLHDFVLGGYRFIEAAGDGDTLIFQRDEAVAA